MNKAFVTVPYAQAVRGALSRLGNHSQIGTAPKLSAFLTFVVEKALAGDAKSLKAYTIAVGALGRDKNFNPATDAIVRVEAGRLREALARYYANEGARDPVIIDIPRGSYVPSFAWNNFREVKREPLTRASLELTAERDRLKLLFEESRRIRMAQRTLVAEFEDVVAAARQTATQSMAILERARSLSRQRLLPAKEDMPARRAAVPWLDSRRGDLAQAAETDHAVPDRSLGAPADELPSVIWLESRKRLRAI